MLVIEPVSTMDALLRNSGSAPCTVEKTLVKFIRTRSSNCFSAVDPRESFPTGRRWRKRCRARRTAPDGGEEALAIGCDGEVAGNGDGAAAHRLRRCGEGVEIAAGDGDLRALGGEKLRGREADAAVASGDERDFSASLGMGSPCGIAWR